MDENLSRGYVQLGKAREQQQLHRAADHFHHHHDYDRSARQHYQNKTSSGTIPNRMGIGSIGSESDFARIAPPVDSWNFIYLSLLLAGAGFLLPYNSFIIAVDYFQARYPKTTIMFDMSTVYIVTAFVAVLLNNVLVETLSLSTRITFGYLISFLTLNFVVICEIWWEVFGVATSYTINLVAIAVVSFGCTVQQSSFYGYTSMLPTRYTQAVMAGESAAGFWVSLNRIITKLATDDERGNTSMFFVLSITTIVMCFVLQQKVYKTEFVQYYVSLCNERNKITLEPQEDVGLIDPFHDPSDTTSTSRGQYGVLKLQSPVATGQQHQPIGDSASGSIDMTNATGQFFEFSFSNPVYDPNAPVTASPVPGAGTTYKVEDIIMRGGGSGTSATTPSTGSNHSRWAGIRRGLVARLEVSKQIEPYMLSIGLAYAVTLSLYPGIVSEITSCNFRTWMPVILMTAFNGADLIGKMLATISVHWSRTMLINFSYARIILIPLLMMCATPRTMPIFSNEWAPLVLALILGITNGIVGSVPMVQAPLKVAVEHRELAGNIMTLSYTSGLTFGSVFAYLLADYLGPRIPLDELCKSAISTSPLSIPAANATAASLAEMTSAMSTTTALTTNGPGWATTLASSGLLLTKKMASAIGKSNKSGKSRNRSTTTPAGIATTIGSLLATGLMTASQRQPGPAGLGLVNGTAMSYLAQNFTTAITNDVSSH